MPGHDTRAVRTCLAAGAVAAVLAVSPASASEEDRRDARLQPERLVMMVYALHDFSRPAAFLRNLKKYLKPGGAVVILDQDPEASGNHHFLTRERYVELFAESGYALARDERFLEKDLLLVFRPS